MSMFFGMVQQKGTLVVGQAYLGGKVAYIKVSGDPGYDAAVQHGYVVSLTDIGSGAWGCSGTDWGAYGLLLDDGLDNTTIITSNCLTPGIAAKLAIDWLFPNGWYLPSQGEMLKVWINRVAIGGLASAGYWTSSEIDAISAYRIRTTDGLPISTTKSTSFQSRAIRSF